MGNERGGRLAFVPVAEEEDGRTIELPQEEKGQDTASVRLLGLALQALGQRALVAISALFTAAALFSAWWLWNSALPDPKPLQLIGLGMYAAFVLVLEWVRRRKKE